MSDLIQKNESPDFRWKLLAEVSALALLGYVASAPAATAEEGDRPTVWIELGGQLSRWENSQEPYAPPFVALTPSGFTSPLKAERTPRYGWDESTAFVLQPKGSDWRFSASIRYGRSGNSKHTREQSSPASLPYFTSFHRSRNGHYRHVVHYYTAIPQAPRFTDVVAKQNESHAILDFQAGKDFGIGLFARSAISTLDVGVRFAQFTSHSSIKLNENPDWQFKTHITTFSSAYDTYYGGHYSIYRRAERVSQPFHNFAGTFLASRSFTGLGPSISWDSSEALAGDLERGALTIDWGVNGSLLFGRQKTKIHHQTTGKFNPADSVYSAPAITYQRPAIPDHARSRGVLVPNIGAFAGLSLKYPNAKVSFGYRADFFFGAMDGGIDARRTEDVGFHGPYASVSIGLGG